MIEFHTIYDLILDKADQIALYHAGLFSDGESYWLRAEAAVISEVEPGERISILTNDYSCLIKIPGWLENYQGSVYWPSGELDQLIFEVYKLKWYQDKYARTMEHKPRKMVDNAQIMNRANAEKKSQDQFDEDDD